MFTPLKGILWSFEPSKSGIMLPFQGKVSVRVKISYVNCGQENAFNSCVRTQGHTQCVFSGSAGCRQELHRVPLSQYKHVKSKLCCTNTSANALNGCYAPSRRGGETRHEYESSSPSPTSHREQLLRLNNLSDYLHPVLERLRMDFGAGVGAKVNITQIN